LVLHSRVEMVTWPEGVSNCKYVANVDPRVDLLFRS